MATGRDTLRASRAFVREAIHVPRHLLLSWIVHIPARALRTFVGFILIALGLAATTTSLSAQQFPSRPVTVVVGYSAGGQADVLARTISKRLEEIFKVPFVIENRAGANGMIAAQTVAKATPDGQTLLLVTDGMMTIDAHLQAASKFDIVASFDPLINFMHAPLFLAANKDLPAENISSLVEFGKQNPQSLSFGTSGSSTPHRIAGEMLQKRGGFKMLHVPYKGTAASVADLAGGQIPLVFGAVTALKPLADSGQIKLLGVTSKKRYPSLPNVPAISETFEGFDLVSYIGLVVPKGTPKETVSTLNNEINRVLAEPEVRKWMDAQGMIPAGGSPEDFKRQIDSDFQSRGELVREIGLKSE